jgi:hypothetical protein
MSRNKPAPRSSNKAKPKKDRAGLKTSAITVAKKLLLEGLQIRGELVPANELGPNPKGGVTHVETPSGAVKRVAFSAV